MLRALVRQEGTAERANLLHKLVRMSDAERQRLVDDFLDEVSAGLPAEVNQRVRATQPRLPHDPTSEQLDAWITLAEMLRDTQFRDATRTYLRETYAEFPGSEMSAPPVQAFINTAGTDLMPRLIAARNAGFAANDTPVVALAARFVEQLAQTLGIEANDELRHRLAARYHGLDSVILEALEDAEYTATEGRYLELVSIINNLPHPDAALLEAARRDQTPASETSGRGSPRLSSPRADPRSDNRVPQAMVRSTQKVVTQHPGCTGPGAIARRPSGSFKRAQMYGGRAWVPAVRRRAPADDHREAPARPAARRHPRRGDGGAGLDIRGRRAGGAQRGARGTQSDGDRTPSLHRPQRGPDPRG